MTFFFLQWLSYSSCSTATPSTVRRRGTNFRDPWSSSVTQLLLIQSLVGSYQNLTCLLTFRGEIIDKISVKQTILLREDDRPTGTWSVKERMEWSEQYSWFILLSVVILSTDTKITYNDITIMSNVTQRVKETDERSVYRSDVRRRRER